MARIELSRIPASVLMSEGSDAEHVVHIESLVTELNVLAQIVENERREVVGGITKREMVFVGGDFCYLDEGKLTKYSKMLETSRQSYGGNEQLVRRFESELVVWKMASQMTSELEIGDGIVIVSPPREEYRFGDEPPLSATFVIVRGEGDKYLAYSLYTPEIEEEELLQAVGLPVNLDKKSVLETPIVVKKRKLDGVVGELGFAGWDEIERRVVDLDNPDQFDGRVVNQAILQLRSKFLDQKGEFFWDKFSKMVRDLLLKDLMGEFVDKDQKEIYQNGLIYLQIANENELTHELSWIMGMEGISGHEIEKWIIRQEELQQMDMYRAMWGGHGNGSSVLSFDQKGNHLDMRADRVMSQDKKTFKLKCGNCNKSFESPTTKCKCPNCNENVSKGGE